MAKNFSKKYTHSVWGNILSGLFLAFLAFVMVVPMVFTFSNAFKPLDELFLFPPSLFVKNPTLMNFYSLSSLMRESWIPLSRYIFNSVFVTLVGTTVHIIIASLAAYRLAKFEFPGRRLMFSAVQLALMFSSTVTAIPNYIIMSKLGMIDHLTAIIIPAFAAPMGLFLMKQFMEQMVPDALIEAAKIDGAGDWKIFIRVVMPVVKPAWITLLIFSFRDLWNNAGTTYIFNERYKTLPYALQSVVSGGIARTGAASAVSLIMIIPPIIVFIISQSNIMETMATSGMKD